MDTSSASRQKVRFANRTNQERQLDYENRKLNEIREYLPELPTNRSVDELTFSTSLLMSAAQKRPSQSNKLNVLEDAQVDPKSLEQFACRTGRHFKAHDLIRQQQQQQVSQKQRQLPQSMTPDLQVVNEQVSPRLKLSSTPVLKTDTNQSITINLLLQKQAELIEKTKRCQLRLHQKQKEKLNRDYLTKGGGGRLSTLKQSSLDSLKSLGMSPEEERQGRYLIKPVIPLNELIKRPTPRQDAFLVMEEAEEDLETDEEQKQFQMPAADSILSQITHQSRVQGGAGTRASLGRLNLKSNSSKAQLPPQMRVQRASVSKKTLPPLNNLSPTSVVNSSGFSNYQLREGNSCLKSARLDHSVVSQDQSRVNSSMSDNSSSQQSDDPKSKYLLRHFPVLNAQRRSNKMKRLLQVDRLNKDMPADRQYADYKPNLSSLDKSRSSLGHDDSRHNSLTPIESKRKSSVMGHKVAHLNLKKESTRSKAVINNHSSFNVRRSDPNIYESSIRARQLEFAHLNQKQHELKPRFYINKGTRSVKNLLPDNRLRQVISFNHVSQKTLQSQEQDQENHSGLPTRISLDHQNKHQQQQSRVDRVYKLKLKPQKVRNIKFLHKLLTHRQELEDGHISNSFRKY